MRSSTRTADPNRHWLDSTAPARTWSGSRSPIRVTAQPCLRSPSATRAPA
ncbi:Uncharacterised protein [Mycobacteroides abscessus subsp. abscessus]|nr:Uncharacterised protein [Mycobacteroides abscessus subsp. abscessus]